MLRYIKLAWRFFSLSTAREMQYRAHFIGTVASGLAHILLFLIFIETVLGQVGAIGSWDRPRMYLLYGTFVLVYGLAEFAVQPNIDALSDSVRRGELDYVFTKPVDAQVYVSLQHYHLPSLAGVIMGMLIVGYGCLQLALTPAWYMIGAYLLLLVCGLVVIYSLWLLSALIVFRAIRVDSIAYLFIPIVQFARYPISAYPRFLQTVFRFVFPLAFVATVPAERLLGLSSAAGLATACITAVCCLLAARIGWRFALRSYASASS